MGDNPTTLTGIQVLVQGITIMMLSKPGSDALAREDGVDLLGIIRRATQSVADHRTDAIMAYSLLRERMIEIQSGEDVPDNERLDDLQIVRIYPEGERMVHVLKIVSAAGEDVTIDTKDLFLE